MMKRIQTWARKNKKRSIFLFLIICFLLVGIILFLRINAIYKPVPAPAQILFPFSPSSSLHEINSWNVKNLQQIHQFEQYGSSVLKTSLSVDGCCILAINQDGLMQKWDMQQKGKLIATYQLGETHPRAVNFSADGSRLVTPGQILDNGEILGATVWNTATGKSIFCEGNITECPDGYDWDAQKGFLLDPSGKWLFEYGLRENEYADYQDSTFITQNIDDSSANLHGSIYIDKEIYFHDANAEVAMITADSNTQYLVYAFSNGLVRVETAHYDLFRPLYRFDYTDGVEKTKVEVVDLAIDNTLTWLAQLRNNELLIWNMQRGVVFPLALRVPISNGTALAFDHAGQILAVATSTEIRFYDLNWGTVSGSISTQGTSTLTFSRDNRMLISGDSIGNVYVWGIP